ncbi:MAG: Nucleoside-diphosphate-sugar pyrophosphorylase family protein [Deltaproteobacteria bacterium]|nr:Nucleoside-diphosphate-sugar pyrophosphorylase family protein [Deltaproteobacteria bacterium]MBS1244897.1 Nucleoside-diphosphate-sugar pyrophosphorylase family protein [Deltaproteobacteria bacterium]
MKAMLLAAGLGTRLRPLSLEIPKPVIPVLGEPLCGHAMAFLHAHGADSFLLNLHHGPETVRGKVTAWAAGRFPVEFAYEPEILGTGGGIGNAREYLRGGTFLTANSDAVVRFPLANALASHRATGALATLVLLPDRSKRYTPVRVRDDGRIAGFGGAAPAGASEGFYTGYLIAEPELLDRIPRGRPSCIVRDTFVPLIATGAPIFAFMTEGTFLDFGTPADYLRGTLALLAEREVGKEPHSFAHPRASIGKGATVGPDAVVEEGAAVGAGAAVRRAILWPGAVVPPGALVENGILTPRGFVPA